MTPFLIRAIKKVLNIPATLPDFAQIEITNICNLNCKMCVRNAIELDIKHMNFDIFKQVVDKLKGVHTLILTGYGEPLCHDRIFEVIRYCKDGGFEVQLTSNGLLLNSDEQIAVLVDSGLDSISFSVESVTSVNDVIHKNLKALDNIKRLLEFREERQCVTPTVTLQTLIMKHKEQDLFDIIEWGSSIGVDRINVARFDLNPFPEMERLDIREEKRLFKEFARLRKKHNIRIDCIQDQMYDGLKGFLYRWFKYFLGMDRNCIRLQDFLYINLNGYVRPCCALVDYKMGNLLESSLEEIWRSQKYKNFRKNYSKVPWCGKCDIFTLKQKC